MKKDVKKIQYKTGPFPKMLGPMLKCVVIMQHHLHYIYKYKHQYKMAGRCVKRGHFQAGVDNVGTTKTRCPSSSSTGWFTKTHIHERSFLIGWRILFMALTGQSGSAFLMNINEYKMKICSFPHSSPNHNQAQSKQDELAGGP